MNNFRGSKSYWVPGTGRGPKIRGRSGTGDGNRFGSPGRDGTGTEIQGTLWDRGLKSLFGPRDGDRNRIRDASPSIPGSDPEMTETLGYSRIRGKITNIRFLAEKIFYRVLQENSDSNRLSDT